MQEYRAKWRRVNETKMQARTLGKRIVPGRKTSVPLIDLADRRQPQIDRSPRDTSASPIGSLDFRPFEGLARSFSLSEIYDDSPPRIIDGLDMYAPLMLQSPLQWWSESW